MFRKVMGVAVVCLLCVGVVFAAEVSGVCTKVDGNKITFYKTTFNKDTKTVEKGDAQVLTVGADCKISMGKFNKDTKKLEAGDALEGGLKNKLFSEIGDKGVRCTVDIDGTTAKSIIAGGGKGK